MSSPIDSREGPLVYVFSFANDIVLVDGIRSAVNVRLEIWWDVLEPK